MQSICGKYRLPIIGTRIGKKPIYLGLLLLFLLLGSFDPVLGGRRAQAGEVASSAVVFMYHRFGETDYPSTNVRIEQFAAHLAEIKAGGYNVMSLPEIITTFRRQETLPERTIALTIDDAFLSVYDRAWPMLAKAGLPFTLFVATNAIDAKRPGHMTWAQLRALAAAGVPAGTVWRKS